VWWRWASNCELGIKGPMVGVWLQVGPNETGNRLEDVSGQVWAVRVAGDRAALGGGVVEAEGNRESVGGRNTGARPPPIGIDTIARLRGVVVV